MPASPVLFGSSSLRGALARGVLVGGVAAVGWAVARRFADDRDLRLLDWETATRVATRVGGGDGVISFADRARLQEEYETMVRDIERPIADYTGTTLPLGEIDVRVLDRAEWIRANVASFQQMFRPLEEVYAETLKRGGSSIPGMSALSRTMLSSQVGLLLGFLARKVLGQYDISLLGHEPLQAGKLYFVEPNIRALQRTLNVPEHDIRKWIALHEATHAHEFEVHPWVRGYLNGQLEGYLRSMAEELTNPGAGGVLGGLAARLVVNLRQGHNLIEAMMSPHQRQMLSRLQALMSLAEGYSNHVMNRVGEKLLPAYADIHERVEHRQRNRSQIEELFLRLTGLKMKMEQYALGEKFAGHVADARGVTFLNRAWQSAECLPTEAEIRAPDRWIERIDRYDGAAEQGAASRVS
jgi:coenzyme F420 biosynthesis associated uncharacterized protein